MFGGDYDVTAFDTDAWRLIDASADHERVLVRAEVSSVTDPTDDPYVLFDVDRDNSMNTVQAVVSLNGRGETLDDVTEEVFVRNSLAGAALSPDGEWLVYTLDRGMGFEVYRLPVNDEVSTMLLPPETE